MAGLLHSARRTRWACLIAIAAGTLIPLFAQPKPPAASGPPATITVRLVTDFQSGRPVSDAEALRPVTTTVFGPGGSTEKTLGEEAELWVRNAHVDGKFFFERYYQGKYIGRKSEIEIDAKQLSPGEHVIQPGGHRFTVNADGTLASDDPEIRIVGSRVELRMHRVTVVAVDGARSGPAEFRKVPATLGLFAADAGLKLDPASLPDPSQPFDPQKPPAAGQPVPPLTNLLSHQAEFYPLHVWLPSNALGQGYVLYPSWQAFHVKRNGTVVLSAGEAPRVASIEADGGTIMIPYRTFRGKRSSTTGLAGGVDPVPLGETMSLGATLSPLRFRAGIGKPPDDFLIAVDNDLSKRPHKFFLADNTSADPQAVRLMALEWDRPIFERKGEATVSLRLLESAGATTLARPRVVMGWSPFAASSPASRDWNPVEVLDWQNADNAAKIPATGTPPSEGGAVGVGSKPIPGGLRFRVPDVAAGFVVFRVQVFGSDAPGSLTPLEGEIFAAIVEPGQTGTAAFVTNKGRDAFVCGEEIAVTLVIRSAKKRPASQLAVALTHPDGFRESVSVDDVGEAWATRELRLPSARTANLSPGRYELSVSGSQDGVVSVPFAFTLTGRQPESLYHIVKSSKYTQPMNGLEPSWHQGTPIDLDRAMRTIAELGYTRVDHMSYLTNHHVRSHTWREELAAQDPRLPCPESVVMPSPRDRMLNACVREGLQFSDVFLSYNDFHLPRHIEPYIQASERWLAREVQAMRHSPAFDGMMLYDEMYQNAATGLVKEHQQYFASVRARLVEQTLGQSPSKIEQAFNRTVHRPPEQRDRAALDQFLKYADWQQRGWADFADRMVKVGKELDPQARFGTYHRTWMSPGANDDLYNGWPPDLFRNLDVVSHVHYADNSTCWVDVPMLAQILRENTHGAAPGTLGAEGRDAALRKTLYLNMPLTHEGRTQWDGQYQRQMAFAVLAQGANGVAQWGTPHTFADGPNPGTAIGRSTTALMNGELLRPYGELIDRTADGYRKVGIVSTKNQHALSPSKPVAVAHQTEGIWVACWRLGYPAVFLRDEDLQQPPTGFDVLFVPGVRFDGELSDAILESLKAALQAGTRVVVEKDSTLDLPGLTRLNDWALTDFYVGNYFPTWLDDELHKVYEKSQPIVDYLGPKLEEWHVEPAARGPFTVGPNWRDGGEIQYLVMANFEDPPYGHAVKQQMVKPVKLPLRVRTARGSAAYDLTAGDTGALLEMKPAGFDAIENDLTLDMTRMQGSLVAFAREPVARLEVGTQTSSDGRRVRFTATLIAASGRALDALFPVTITMTAGDARREFHRVLGRGIVAEFDLPASREPSRITFTVREGIAGQTVAVEVAGPAIQLPSMDVVKADEPIVPYPADVVRFLAATKRCVVVPAPGIPEAPAVANELVAALQARGVAARIVPEAQAWRHPHGDPKAEDPLGDGFHSWRSGQETIGPAMVVDEPVVLLGGPRSSNLLDALLDHGYLTVAPLGRPGEPSRPTLQVAGKGLHFAHDALCLTGNDAASLRKAVQRLAAFAPLSDVAVRPTFAEPVVSRDSKPTPAASFASIAGGSNELVMDVQCDPAGNLYVSTWGHGRNLYAFAPDGAPRFQKHLPEMGVNRLAVHDDRLFAYTAAGARLYELSLDGRAVAQARINMDPGSTHYTDDYELSTADFQWLPQRKQLLCNLGDRVRLLDEEYRIVAEWPGEEFVDADVSDDALRRKLGPAVLSPDGQTLAQLESSWYFTKVAYQDVQVFDTHLVLRDLSGKLLAEAKQLDNYSQSSADAGERAELAWPKGAPGPVVYVKGERRAFASDLSPAATTAFDKGAYWLGDDRRLLRDGRELVYFDRADHEQCRIGPFDVLPTFTRLSPDGSHLATLAETGLLRVFRTAGGSEAFHAQTATGTVVRFTPDSQRLIIGGVLGTLDVFDLAGKLLWRKHLASFNAGLGGEPALYDASIPDHTDRLWPTSRDRAGEWDELVRLDPNRLVNGDAESDAGWTGAPQFVAGGHDSPRALKVTSEGFSQELTGHLGNHTAWVLEFWYRDAESSDQSPRGPTLLAGLLSDSDPPMSVARRLSAARGIARTSKDWTFARIVLKTGHHSRKLTAGFASEHGDVLVDGIALRRVRFPSVNHLLYEPLHAVEPVVLENPLFSARYDPLGTLREEAPNRVLVQGIKTGAMNLVEGGFLQNGRLNDIGSRWYIQPLDEDPSISLSFREPRWVSLLALYFHVHNEANVAPHFDVFAVDASTGKDRKIARVRHNGQVVRLVKFPPVKTPLIKVKLVNSIARLRTLTEIEAYGPLSGREGTPGFVDPDGQNTWMGDFTRVDKREKRLPEQFLPPVVKGGAHDDEVAWYAPLAQILAGDDRFYVARTFGKNNAFALAEPQKELYWGRASGLGYTPYGALYGGLLLRPGNDGKLYCLHPDSGTELWSTKLGERLFGCPVAIGEDVFMANESGRLFQLDLASGGALKEAELSGGVFGALATDGTRLVFLTDDGSLQCWNAADLSPVWKTPIAADSDSTPAIDRGVVYSADRNGTARAVSLADGSIVWTAELGDEFTQCPVVMSDRVILGCRGGTLAVLDRSTGQTVWTKKVSSRFRYEPVVLGDDALYFHEGKAMLAKLADGSERPLEFAAPPQPNKPLERKPFVLPEEPIVPIAWHRGCLFFVDPAGERGHNQMHVNYPWHPVGGSFTVLRPAIAAPIAPSPGK